MHRSFDRNYILAHMVLLPKKHRTHYSRPKRCSQKVLQTRLLYTFPLKMYQYFKYSNSRSVSSSCFGSLDIRSPGVFTETFLDHYHLDICKSNTKTHKIISINRFTCCYFSSRNIPAIADSAFCFDIAVELNLFAVKPMFWLRSGPITLQEITYPDLVVARTAQYEISGKNHICSAKTFSSKPQSTHQRRKMHWDKQHFP